MWGKENLFNSLGISLRELQLFRQAGSQEGILLRLSHLPASIIGGIKDNPGRSTLLLIFALGAAEVMNLGKQVIEDQARVGISTPAPKDVTQPNITIIIPQPPSPERSIQPTERITKYMNDYITNDLGARTREKFEKFWRVTTTEPVQIYVTEESGIRLRDFPDPKFGRRIPTDGSQKGYYWKTLEKDGVNPLPGLLQYFIVVNDPETADISIWAVRWSNEGGWPGYPQPHFETFAVYYDGQWFVSFVNEESALSGKTIPGEELFRRAWPPLNPPKKKAVETITL